MRARGWSCAERRRRKMITATSNASNESNQLPPATATARSSGHSHLRNDFAEFVGLALTRADRFPNLNRGEKPDVWDLREAAERRELLEKLEDHFQQGYSEPLSDLELIGVVWFY